MITKQQYQKLKEFKKEIVLWDKSKTFDKHLLLPDMARLHQEIYNLHQPINYTGCSACIYEMLNQLAIRLNEYLQNEK